MMSFEVAIQSLRGGRNLVFGHTVWWNRPHGSVGLLCWNYTQRDRQTDRRTQTVDK